MRKTTPNPSLRASYISASRTHGVGQGARHMARFPGSQTGKNILDRGGNSKSNGPGRGRGHDTTGRTVRVLDEDGTDVTPQPLYHVESGDTQPKQGRFFLDENFSSSGSDHSQSTSSYSIRSSSSFRSSSLCDKLPPTNTEDGLPKLDIPTPYVFPRKRDGVKKHITEEELRMVVDIYLTESDTTSLLDIPCTLISEDADDGEAVKERNIHYAELCKNRMDNDKYVVQSMQTFNGELKDKQIQCQHVVMVENGATATVWDIYDSLSIESETAKSENDPNSTLSTSNIQENRQENSSSSGNSSSSVYTGSIINSLLETDSYWKSQSVEPNLQEIMGSESIQHNLLIMMRTVVANIFQPKLAAYRQLPVVDDPYSAVKLRIVEQAKEDEKTSLPPALECLWAFSCELTSGWNITSMSLNKMDLNLLAVGYGELKGKKPGLICCWSFKNPVWPEHVFHCHSAVTCLAFSAANPSHLAVGMFDGTIALYNIQFPDNRACFTSSRDCFNKHLQPVWQVQWSRQDEIRVERVEALVSVSDDGRIKKWYLCRSGLECIDLMELKRPDKHTDQDEKKKKQGRVVTSLMPGFCINFHSIESSIYLIGTQSGLIHKCSLSNSQHFLDTYQKHFVQVNHIEWSPFSPDVFLSCSTDWTIQLWRQSHPTPVMSFTSAQRTVYSVSWSPNHSTVFAAINGQQVEIWDLNTCILEPTIVHQATPGVKLTALLLANGSDCVLVGDSDGKVTVYKPKNFTVGSGKQVHSLDDIIHYAVSREQMV